MPVRELSPPQPSASGLALRDRLIEEWRNPNSTAEQPVILEERDNARRLVHIYVIWEDWSDLSSIERSEIVMEACEAVYDKGQINNVTVAMGLTQAEAARLGIH